MAAAFASPHKLAAAWAAALLVAHASQAQVITAAPHPAAGCVAAVAGAEEQPVYPEVPWKERRGGRVKVELEFGKPDARPSVSMADSEGGDDFVEAVRTHVRTLRALCLKAADGPLKILREYVFIPDRRVAVWSGETAAEDRRTKDLLACITPDPKSIPRTYPNEALRAELQGRVVAEVLFNSPDSPPLVRLHHPPQARLLARGLPELISQLRMPCHTGQPVHVYWTIVFTIEGLPAYGFRGIDFRAFVLGVKGIRQQILQFDTQTMGCPFDVRLRYLQPVLRNQVAELGQSRGERGPLLQWLAGAELALNAVQQQAAFGDDFTLTVPCINIDIKPT